VTRALLAAALLAQAACLESHATVCASGRVCPDGTVCDDEHDLCVLEEQLGACETDAGTDLDDEVACDIAGEPIGFCLDGDCLRARCGDGRITNNERCDPADDLSRTSTCDEEGFYVGGEVACTDECRYDVALCTGFCGDEHVDVEMELCDGDLPDSSCVDFGFDGGALACNGLCGGDTSGCRLVGFKRSAVPTDRPLLQLHGTAPDDVYAVSDLGELFHGDGSGWIQAPGSPAAVRHVWAAARDDVYASAACLTEEAGCGRLFHFDGDDWTQIVLPQGGNQASGGGIVWGAAPDVVYWFAEGITWRGHGEDPDDWSEVKALDGVLQPLDAWSSSADDVYLVSKQDGVFHRNGQGWSELLDLPFDTPLVVWGSAPDDVWLGTLDDGMFRWDGEEWLAEDKIGGRAIWGTASDNVFMIGAQNTFLHFDGTSWRSLHQESSRRPYFDVWGTSAGHVLVSGEPGFLGRYHDGLWWEMTDYPEGIDGVVRAIDAASVDEVYAIQEDDGGVAPAWFLHRWNGLSWEEVDTDLGLFAQDVWVAGPGVAFVVGGQLDENLRRVVVEGVVTKTAAGFPVNAVGGTGPTMVVAVGALGGILEYDGNDGFVWTLERDQGDHPDLLDLWVDASGEAFAVGADGEVVRRDPDGTWAVEDSTVSVDLRAVWGRSPDDLYAVGDGGAIVHRDGTGWSTIGDLGVDLTGIAGTDDGDLFVVGQAGGAFHWDGERWNPVRIPGDVPSLRAVHAIDNHVLFGGGPLPAVVLRLARHRSWLVE